jgi:hypothetical protein
MQRRLFDQLVGVFSVVVSMVLICPAVVFFREGLATDQYCSQNGTITSYLDNITYNNQGSSWNDGSYYVYLSDKYNCTLTFDQYQLVNTTVLWTFGNDSCYASSQRAYAACACDICWAGFLVVAALIMFIGIGGIFLISAASRRGIEHIRLIEQGSINV